MLIQDISPASCSYHETLNTLLFAQRAKKIVNKPKINEDPKTALIKELRQEINQLKQFLMQSSIYSMPANEVSDSFSLFYFCYLIGHSRKGSNEIISKEFRVTFINIWTNIFYLKK